MINIKTIKKNKENVKYFRATSLNYVEFNTKDINPQNHRMLKNICECGIAINYVHQPTVDFKVQRTDIDIVRRLQN